MPSSNSRRQFSSELKLKAVLETLQRDTTIEAVRKKFGVHITQLGNWRKQFFTKTPQIASLVYESAGGGSRPKTSSSTKTVEELTRIIGELTIENSILKKALENLG